MRASRPDDGMSSGAVSFAGRTVVVTGSGQGIGRRLAKRFSELSANVVVADIVGANGERVAAEIVAAGGQAFGAEVDVAAEASVAGLVERTLEEYGGIDVLVNNAAIFSSLRLRPFEQISRSEWDLVLRVNVTGVFVCAQAVAPVMRSQGRGRIINISSLAARVGAPGYLHYVTSKEAVIGLTRGLARELGDSGVTVNAILPPGTLTEVPRESFSATSAEAALGRQSIKRPSTPDDLADVAIWLASSGGSFVTGQSIIADGGAYFG
jgi:3-oxoacyl-[acyl-carrier protein] reductase